MAYASDSVPIPNSAEGHAGEVIDGKFIPVVMLVGSTGHKADTQETYYAWVPFSAAGAANQRLIDLFNASGSGKIVKVKKLFMQCSGAVIVGVPHHFDAIRTSAVGTGGTAVTVQKTDTANANLPAGITARGRATGGATENGILFAISVDPEETRPGTALMGMVNWIPEADNLQALILREGEGILVKQITNNTAAFWGCLIVFTVH